MIKNNLGKAMTMVLAGFRINKPAKYFRKKPIVSLVDQKAKITAAHEKRTRKNAARLNCYIRGVLSQPIISRDNNIRRCEIADSWMNNA